MVPVIRRISVHCEECASSGAAEDYPYHGMDESYALRLSPSFTSGSNQSGTESETSSRLVAVSRHGLNRGLETLFQVVSALTAAEDAAWALSAEKTAGGEKHEGTEGGCRRADAEAMAAGQSRKSMAMTQCQVHVSAEQR